MDKACDDTADMQCLKSKNREAVAISIIYTIFCAITIYATVQLNNRGVDSVTYFLPIITLFAHLSGLLFTRCTKDAFYKCKDGTAIKIYAFVDVISGLLAISALALWWLVPPDNRDWINWVIIGTSFVSCILCMYKNHELVCMCM